MRDAVLYTLAQAATAGMPELATQPANVFDPLLRPFIKMQVRSAISKAASSTKLQNGEHILRLAFLQKLGPLPQEVGVDDEAAVSKAFEAQAKPWEQARKPRRLLTLLVAVSVLAGAGLLLYLKLRPSNEARFISSPLGLALAEPLTRFSEGNESSKREAARKDILAEPVRKQIGDDAFKLLEIALDGPSEFTTSKNPPEQDGKTLADKAKAFNEALEKQKIPGFLGVEANARKDDTRTAGLFALQVHERAKVTVNDKTLDVTWGYRLDEGRAGRARVARPLGADWAVVNLDTVANIWPKLIIPTVMLQKASGNMKEAAKELLDFEKLVGKIIREDIRSCVGVDDATMERLTDEIQQRDDRYKQVEKNFKLEDKMDRPTIFQTPAARVELNKMKDDPLVAEALEWDDRLRSDYDPITKVLAPFARAEEESYLYGLLAEEKIVAKSEPKEPEEDDLEARPRRGRRPPVDTLSTISLAGRLAALSREGKCPKLETAYHLYQSVLNLSPEDVMVLGSLLGELGLATDETWAPYGINQSLLGSTLAEALGKSPADIRAAAVKAYEKWFGHAPLEYKRVTR